MQSWSIHVKMFYLVTCQIIPLPYSLVCFFRVSHRYSNMDQIQIHTYRNMYGCVWGAVWKIVWRVWGKFSSCPSRRSLFVQIEAQKNKDILVKGRTWVIIWQSLCVENNWWLSMSLGKLWMRNVTFSQTPRQRHPKKHVLLSSPHVHAHSWPHATLTANRAKYVPHQDCVQRSSADSQHAVGTFWPAQDSWHNSIVPRKRAWMGKGNIYPF